MGSTSRLSTNVIEKVIKSLDALVQATDVKTVLEQSRQIQRTLHLENKYGIQNFITLSTLLDVKIVSKWNRIASILKALEKKVKLKEYENRQRLRDRTILVIGGGIAGLRVAIELLLIGAKVICVEKRDEFSRNNVIHLWPNVINDMCSFEAKRFYRHFCVGSIDHISIRQIQLVLLKIAVIYGVRFIPNIAFDEICPRLTEPREESCTPGSCNCCCHSHGFGRGAYAHFSSSVNPSVANELHSVSFDTIIGSDGSRNTFTRYFPRNSRRGKLAIGLTANFVNHRTEEETHCPEISGVSKIYKQQWFKDLETDTGIELENIVYYRDETHYFVMTATKQSLLRRGVLKNDFSTDQSELLLHDDNIDLKSLMNYSKDAAKWSSKLRGLEFARKPSGKPDIQLFDFTSMYSATNASCAKKTYLKCCQPNIRTEATSSTYSLLLLCGDSLLEPFWPTGSGAGRGFLSAIDAAWTVQMWFNEASPLNIESMLNVIAKREHVYRLLAQTNPENTTAKGFTIDPQTRYKNLNLRESKALFDVKQQVKHLIIDKRNMDVKKYNETKRQRRATVGVEIEELRQAQKWSKELRTGKYDFDDLLTTSYPNPFQMGSNHNSASTKVHNRNDNNPSLAVPSVSSREHFLNCDTTTAASTEFKPRNSPDLLQMEPKYVDYSPRNQSILIAQDKKNHEPKNRMFDLEEFSRSPPQRSVSPREVSPKPPVEYTPKECFSKNLDLYKQLFGPDFEEEDENRSYPTSKSTSFGTTRDFHRDFGLEDEFSHPYAAGKPKKSEDILEKAQVLQQVFEDNRKPLEPKLQKVGKIEDEDFNVKFWKSDSVFKPKLPDRQQLVFDNSRDLLQSRIQQMNNNHNYRNELPKTYNSSRARTKDFVNVLQGEIAQKFDEPKAVSPLISVQLLKAQNSNSETINDNEAKVRSSSFTSSKLSTPTNLDSSSSVESIPKNCRRCEQSISPMDTLSIGGHLYHKSCLNCAKCFIMLRQDELVSGVNYLCKLCSSTSRSKSQSHFPVQAPTAGRDSFFAMPASSSTRSIEAKKNFLVNLEQIDLRGKQKPAEPSSPPPLPPIQLHQFERQTSLGPPSSAGLVMDETSSLSKSLADVNLSPLDDIRFNGIQKSSSQMKMQSEEFENIDSDQPEESNAEEENNAFESDDYCADEEEPHAVSSSSELSASDGRDLSSNTNHTGDELSESDENCQQVSRRKHHPSSKSSIPQSANLLLGNHQQFPLADDSADSSPLAQEYNSFEDMPTVPTFQSLPLDLKTVDSQLMTGSCIEPSPSYKSFDSDLMSSSTIGLTNCNANIATDWSAKNNSSSSNNEPTRIDANCTKTTLSKTGEENGGLHSTSVTSSFKLSTTSTTTPANGLFSASKPSLNNGYRYSGGFTEKLYRTRSQPTLMDQLNSIEQRLKNRARNSTQQSPVPVTATFCSGQNNALANSMAKSTVALSFSPANTIDEV